VSCEHMFDAQSRPVLRSCGSRRDHAVELLGRRSASARLSREGRELPDTPAVRRPVVHPHRPLRPIREPSRAHGQSRDPSRRHSCTGLDVPTAPRRWIRTADGTFPGSGCARRASSRSHPFTFATAIARMNAGRASTRRRTITDPAHTEASRGRRRARSNGLLTSN
jgi:hypothetical protein